MADPTVGLSAGTASLLGLSRARAGVAPTTAYIMVGRDCVRACAFCAQARGSAARAHQLSRVTWPPFPVSGIIEPLLEAFAAGTVVRACLQVVGGHEQEALSVLRMLAGHGIATNVSLHVSHAYEVGRWLDAGASRVSLPLDACGREAFRLIKGGDWDDALDSVLDASGRHGGLIGTHIVAGLGESEEDIIRAGAGLLEAGVTVALFAFTPLHGTEMAGCPPPDPASYRRLQAALWLMRRGMAGIDDMQFGGGRLVALGMSSGRLGGLLAGGDAFTTSGCSGCNRPFYNESPRGFAFNFPRRLSAGEAREAVGMVLSGLDRGEEVGP